MASTASPSATPGCRLKEMVTAGKRPWWFTASGAVMEVSLAMALKGTCFPLGDVT